MGGRAQRLSVVVVSTRNPTLEKGEMAVVAPAFDPFTELVQLPAIEGKT